MVLPFNSCEQAQLAANTSSGRARFVKNAGFSLMGQAFPLLVAIVAIPVLIHQMGLERFGFLTIAWALVGYLGLFDLGLGRALTKTVAEALSLGDAVGVQSAISTGLVALSILGGVIALVFFFAAPWVVEHYFKLSPDLVADASQSTRYLAFSIPFVMLISGLKGIIEAHERFDLSAALRAPIGALNYLAPLAMLLLRTDLTGTLIALSLSRLFGTFAYVYVCRRYLRLRLAPEGVSLSHLSALFRFGGWMTVSNIVSPLMNNLDRFLLGMLIPVSMVSYYTTPAEIVNKLAFIPEGIVSVVFPAVVASFAGDRLHASTMYGRGYKLVFLLLLIPIALLFLLGQDILSHWVNPVFAEKAAPALKVLAVGLWINGLARVAFNVIQGAGRPDVTAKIHLVEILPFLTLFYLMVQEYGYLGAAISWMLRVVLDAVIMFNVANRFTPLPITTRQHVFSLLLVLLLWPATMIESTGLMVHAILASLIIVTVVAASAYNFLGWLGLSRIFKF